jgi:hypothetical protein
MKCVARLYNRAAGLERASYNGSTGAFQASDVGSIPTARSNDLRLLTCLRWLRGLSAAWKSWYVKFIAVRGRDESAFREPVECIAHAHHISYLLLKIGWVIWWT